MKELFYQKMDDIDFDQLHKSYRLPLKKNLSVLVQKLTFFAEAKFLTSSFKKEQRINSNFFSDERLFKF